MAAFTKHKNAWTAVTAPFYVKDGKGRASDLANFDVSASPGFVYRFMTADGSQDLDALGTDQFDHLMIGAEHKRPLRTAMQFYLATSASETTQCFFTADQPYEIRGILLQYDTNDGATNTATVTKDLPGQAPGAGVSVMTNTFNLNTTANVNQAAVLASRSQAGVFGQNEPAISLNTGERLSFNMASAVTNLAGVVLTVYAVPENSLAPAVYNFNANAGIHTQCFFLANMPVTISGVSMTWSAAATDTGAVTVDVTKDTSTNAPGAGTSILNAAQSVKGAINTPVNPALTATAATLTMAAGDRLAIKTTGTLTALAGLVVTVSFLPTDAIGVVGTIAGMVQPCFNLFAPGSGVNQGFFIADRAYEVYDVSGVWSTAGGSASRLTVTIDGSTVASGGGTSVLSDNSNAGFDTTATANTVVVGTLATSKRTLYLAPGKRLSVKFGGTVTNLAGAVVAVTLLPR